MKCPNCGAEVTGRFCSYCGSEIPKKDHDIHIEHKETIINNYYNGYKEENISYEEKVAKELALKCNNKSDRLNAIKELREKTGIELKDAINLIDNNLCFDEKHIVNCNKTPRHGIIDIIMFPFKAILFILTLAFFLLISYVMYNFARAILILFF